MPGLMIAMALVLAPAVDSGLKDPWAAAPRASAAKKDPRSHEASPGASSEASAQPATERSPDLRNPFEAPPTPSERSPDLRNPFEAPPTPHSADLRDPFEGAGRHSADLQNPFDPPRPQLPAPHSADLQNPFDRPQPPAPRSADLQNPFEGKSPPSRAADRRKSTGGTRHSPTTGLVDPFQATSASHVEPATRARSLELRNPFAPRPPANRRAR